MTTRRSPMTSQHMPQGMHRTLTSPRGNGQFASIPARGMAMHPHLHLSTRDLDRTSGEWDDRALSGPIALPENSLCEMTLVTRRSSFGDRFTLNSLELGGPATGRSHLLGRLLIQTGERFGDFCARVIWQEPVAGGNSQ